MVDAGDGIDGVDGHDGARLKPGRRRSILREQQREQDLRRQAAREALSPEARKKLNTALLHLSGIIDAARRLGQTALYQELELVVNDIRDAGGG